MSNRRTFMQKLAVLGTSAFTANTLLQELHAAHLEDAYKLLDADNPESDARNEAFWTFFQQAYTVNPNLINLNNGGVSPAPKVVQEALHRYNDLANQAPSYYMWRIIDMNREPLRYKLAQLAGCSTEEIAINRNTTESLNTVIFGLPLQKGDEVIGTLQDYPNMIQAWRQRQMRDGIVYKQISFDFPIESDEIIVQKFAEAMTPKTKVVHITHIVNWVGQILPVKKIADMAHSRGAEVIIDGAHSFGLLNFKIPDLSGDYYGTSLHKFLSAPIGNGLLWIKKEKIGKIWPLLCNDKPQSDDIRKFETLGTRSFCIEQAIGEAINFQEAIGSQRKEDRIRYLKNYWAEKAAQIPKVKLHTSLKGPYSCAIAGVSIDGLKPEELDSKLFNKFKIHAVGINWENIHCVRVTPHVYTRTQDLDKLLYALEQIAAGRA
ncbi:aminotransferase class V-fold PLP-dependent enzyme [Phnomibacter sp.]|uniref:aminotransferase class V-fold PLP-dependent enzyme n=1 Tax=Phnomibacter sp. TaxID=2836217 RepID=UPI002FDE194F